MTIASAGSAAGHAAGSATGILIFIAVFIVPYWIPTIVSWRRKLPNTVAVAVFNGLLGWTIIGWIAAMVYVARSRPQPVMYQAIPPKPDATRINWGPEWRA